jgi:hypothetical protein
MNPRSAIVAVALAGVACGSPSEPPDRSGFYTLVLNATFRDFEAERYFTCEIGIDLSIRVPLPDTFTTVATARVRRMVAWNAGGENAVDSLLDEIPVRLERSRRADFSALSPDSARIILGGVLTDTIVGTGRGGPEGRYDGGWTCDTRVPPGISGAFRDQGYPATELATGEWHLFPVYGGD